MENIPRYWPILCSLEKLNKIEGSSFLQNYLYLVKKEGNVPIEYEFDNEDYLPYSTGIKSDTLVLDKKGFIQMLDIGKKVIFKITEKGQELTKELLKLIPKRNIDGLNKVLNKYKNCTYDHLEKYVAAMVIESFNKHIRKMYEHNQLKKQLLIDIEDLLAIFRSYESSKNSLFIRGSLDYCSNILKKEDIKENIKKDILISNISSYIKQITILNLLVKNEPKLLTNLSLTEYIEKFDYLQDLSKDFNVLPRLDDSDEIDLELFLDDENDYRNSPLFTSSI